MNEHDLLALVEEGSVERPTGPRDLVSCDGYLYALRRIEEERAEVVRMFQPYHQREGSILAKLDAQANWLESLVRIYAADHRDEFVKGGKKSRALPAGTIGFRKVPEKVKVIDESAFLAAAPDELVRVKRSPDLAAITKRCRETGEIPAGCEYIPEAESITIAAADLPTIDADQTPGILGH